MPRAKTENVLSTGPVFTTVEIEAAAGGESKGTKKAQYNRFTDMTAFATFLVDHGAEPLDYGTFFPGTEQKPEAGETVAQFLWRMVNTSLDRKTRADVYESIAAESTQITVGKNKVDILGFPLENLIVAINGMRSQVMIRKMGGASQEDAEKSVGFGPWRTAAKKLVEGYTKEVDGKESTVAPQAKENAATGMLEPLAA